MGRGCPVSGRRCAPHRSSSESSPPRPSPDSGGPSPSTARGKGPKTTLAARAEPAPGWAPCRGYERRARRPCSQAEVPGVLRAPRMRTETPRWLSSRGPAATGGWRGRGVGEGAAGERRAGRPGAPSTAAEQGLGRATPGRGKAALAPGRFPHPSGSRAHIGRESLMPPVWVICLRVGGQFTRKTRNKTNSKGCFRWSPIALRT